MYVLATAGTTLVNPRKCAWDHLARLLRWSPIASQVHRLTCLAANISAELQNLVMDHAPNSDTFQKSYLNHNVTFDLWAL